MPNVLGTRNPSVEGFKTIMKSFSEQMKYNFHLRMVKTAEELAQNIRNAAPKETGALAASVRVIDLTGKRGKSYRFYVWVLAGGRTTLRRTKLGVTFDYAIAEEFGTVTQPPNPFFYNTWRRYRYEVFNQWQETFEQTIKENERIREGKGYRSFNFTSTHGREGTI